MTVMISFFVPGKPQSTARPRFRTFQDKKGNTRASTYNTKSTQIAQHAVREAAQQALSTSGTSGWPAEPLRVTVEARFAWPKSTAKKNLVNRAPMVQRPDVENLVKTIMDGCNGVIYRDDSQVAELIARKVRVVNPLEEGMYVEIEEWEVNE